MLGIYGMNGRRQRPARMPPATWAQQCWQPCRAAPVRNLSASSDSLTSRLSVARVEEFASMTPWNMC
jgi:hypothetical protein